MVHPGSFESLQDCEGMSILNVYDFFNSPDVAEYCQSIGHAFNAFECAVMINQSDRRTLAEKHAAYRAIVGEYPDMEIRSGNNHRRIESFHSALGDIVAYEQHQAERFLSPERGAVYQATVSGRDSGLFTNYEKSLADALEDIKSEEKTAEHAQLSLCKNYPDSERWIAARLSPLGEIMSLRHSDAMFEDSGVETYLLESYIDVPVPFQRGDLVEVGDYAHLFGRSPAPYGGVYVLKDICRNHVRNSEMIYRGDLMDMTANVFYESHGTVRCECIHFYPDLRYCRRELEGETRMLKYVSLFLKEEICACTLLKVQKFLLLDEVLSGLKEDYDLQYQLECLGDKLLALGKESMM